MMQFQLPFLSTLVVAVAATQSLSKEHVALVQNYASTFTTKATKPVHDDANLETTNTSSNSSSNTSWYSCPVGYETSWWGLDGASAIHSSTSTSMSDCEAACSRRAGCTSFEVGSTWFGHYNGCWTYTGGPQDSTSSLQAVGWKTCLASKCPGGYAMSSLDLNGPSGVHQSTNSDLWTCMGKCASVNCTTFEYGPTGCWTYTDGDEDVLETSQSHDWTTCVEVFGRWTATRTGGSKGKTKVDMFCGKSTDILSIGSKPCKYCEKNRGAGVEAQIIVNQFGEERSKGWFCSDRPLTSIVGTPTFEPEEACSNEHEVADEGH